MLALRLMLFSTYYTQNYAGIIGAGLEVMSMYKYHQQLQASYPQMLMHG